MPGALSQMLSLHTRGCASLCQPGLKKGEGAKEEVWRREMDDSTPFYLFQFERRAVCMTRQLEEVASLNLLLEPTATRAA